MNRKEKFMTEIKLAENIRKFFNPFNDIIIRNEPSFDNIYSDFVLEYGGEPFAIIEIKVHKATNDVKKQLNFYFNQFISKFPSIHCYAANIDNSYWLYDASKNSISNESIEFILDKLLKNIYKYADNGDSYRKYIEEFINNRNIWNNYREKRQNYFKRGNLKKVGNCLFLKEKAEIAFMKGLLKSENSKNTKLCRYTTAKNFYQTIKSGYFRLNDIEAMNDALETKVIGQYPHLKSELSTISSYINHGFIMCFSRDSIDKLMNWNMYGDHGKGVCYIIDNIQDIKDFYFAPIVYVNKERGHEILSFLNDLSGLTIDNKYHFHLRLWHIWKYFFKYDYYEGEKEERLLYVTKKQGIVDWSEKYGKTHHVDIGKDNIPFKIEKAILGPICMNSKNTKGYFEEITKQKFLIEDSEIKGYRG